MSYIDYSVFVVGVFFGCCCCCLVYVLFLLLVGWFVGCGWWLVVGWLVQYLNFFSKKYADSWLIHLNWFNIFCHHFTCIYVCLQCINKCLKFKFIYYVNIIGYVLYSLKWNDVYIQTASHTHTHARNCIHISFCKII